MNTKGIKFLAVLAVLAMAFAAVAVITTADDSDAAATGSGKWTYAEQGPLDFAYTAADIDYTDNVNLKNDILVSYDAATKKYTVTGTLAYWANANNDAMAKLGMPAADHHAIAFLVKYDTENAYGVQIGVGDWSQDLTDDEPCMASVPDAKGSKTVTITGGLYAGVYTIDFSGVTLVASPGTTNPVTGYVALANANALKGLIANAQGTDNSNGTWSYVYSTNTLTLTNYNGKEVFISQKAEIFNVALVGNNTITAEGIISGSAGTGYALGVTDQTTSITAGAAASLTINFTKSKYAPGETSFSAIGDKAVTVMGHSTDARITMTLSSPYKAIYAYNAALTLSYADLTLTAGEKTIDAGSVVMTDSKITANLGEIDGNDLGDDDRFGIRAKTAITLNDNKSKIVTQGLRVRSTCAITNAGIIEVSGNYTPVGVTPLIAGLYNESNAEITAYSSKPAAAPYILLTDNAATYGLVVVKKGTGETEQAVVPAATADVDAINNSSDDVVISATAGAADLTAKTLVIEDTKTIQFVTGANTISAKVNVDGQKATFTGVKGNLEITKGSIIVQAGEWSEGTITLEDGAILKLSGTINGDVAIDLADGATSATVIIEGDKSLTINAGKSLAIANKITTEIDGTVIANGTLVNNGTLKVNGTLAGTGTVTNNKVMTVFSGAELTVTTIDGTKLPTGSDGNGGTWSIDAIAATTITLDNYDGTFTFGKFTGALTNIVLVGDNEVTLSDFEMPNEDFAMFTSDATLKIYNNSGEATLTVTAEIETNDYPARTFDVFKATTGMSITGVDVDVEVTGVGTLVNGVETGTFTLFNSLFGVSVCPTMYTPGIYGINATGDVSFQDSTVLIEAGYIGLQTMAGGLATNAVTIDKCTVGVKASQYAINAKSLMITQGSAVDLDALALTVNTKDPAYALNLTGALDVLSHSVLDVTGMYVGGAIKNYAEIDTTGNTVIAGAFTSKTDGVLNNTGTIGVYGSITVEEGSIVNDGTITVLRNMTAANSITNTAAGTNVYIKTIDIDNANVITETATGTASAAVTVTLQNGAITMDKTYYGTITYSAKGHITAADLRLVTYDSGIQYISTVSITTSASTDSTALAPKYLYNIVTSGTIFDGAALNTVGTATYGTAAVGQTITLLAIDGADSTIEVAGGDFINNGTLSIGKMAAAMEIVSDGTLTNNGKLSLANDVEISGGELMNLGEMKVSKNITVSGGDLVGDFSVSSASVITVVGAIDSQITYKGTYKYRPAGSDTDQTLPFENVMDVLGKGASTGFVITATTNANAPSTLNLTEMDKVSATTGAIFVVQKGIAMLGSDVASKAVITALDGTTLQVMGTSAVAGVIAIQDGATFNRWIDNVTETYTYGKATYVIEFANEGYTYYGNLAFALANAPENAKMTLSSTTTIDADTAVKAGVELTFANGVNLTIAGQAGDGKDIDFSMGDGAKFIVPAGAVISFNYVTASANIEYGDNLVVLDNVVFDKGVASTITATAGSSSVPAGFTLAFQEVDDGSITFVEGYSYGAIILDSVLNTAGTAAKTYGEVIIADDAVSKIAIAAGANPEFVSLIINGDFYFTANANLVFPMVGAGEVILANGVTVISVENIEQNIFIGNGIDGFMLLGAVGDNEDLDYGASFTIKSVAATSTVAAYVQLGGFLYDGIATAAGNVTATDLLINADEDATATLIVPLDAVLTIEKNADLFANGLVMVAGTINMYTEDTKNYGELNYQVTFEDKGYLVYTTIATGASMAPSGTDFVIEDDMVVDDPLILENGNTITVAYGKVLTIDNTYIVLGKAATTLGAADAIVGDVVLDGSFVIVYTNADISGANFYQVDGKTAAVSSNYSIKNVTYCDVYADNGIAFNMVDGPNATIGTPLVSGFNFRAWAYYTGGAGDSVGSTNVYATGANAQVKITLKTVAGAVYKVNGQSDVILDTPFYVDYGTIINAVAASGYTGATQSWTADKDMTITASGFSPVAPEPTPEEKSEWTITTILLVILVILIAIMVIIMILRLNRS